MGVGQRARAALRDDELRRRHGRLRRAQLLRPRSRAARDDARRAARRPRRGARDHDAQRPPLSTFFRAWFDHVVPALGRVAGDPDAYAYLPSSVKRFPAPQELAQRLARRGLTDIRYLLTAGGIIAIHVGPRAVNAAPRRRRAGRRRRRARPGLLAAVEDGWGAAAAHGEVLAGTAARRSPPAASGCARCSWCSRRARRPSRTASGVVRAARGGRARAQRDARPRRRARRAPLRRGRPDRRRHGRPRDGDGDRRPAVLARLRRAGAQRARRPRSASSATPARRSRAASCSSAPTPGTPTCRVERYLLRCELKTASLFAAACGLGALEGGGPAEALGDFGRRIGLAFQLLDDVLDVSGPAERTGKHRGTDLLDGTVTLPFILARERDRELARLDPRAVPTPAQAEAVCDAIAASGALDEVRDGRWRWSQARRRTCRAAGGPARGAGARRRRRRRPLQLSARPRSPSARWRRSRARSRSARSPPPCWPA